MTPLSLSRFVHRDQARSAWLLKPFAFDVKGVRYVGATDGHRAAIVAAVECDAPLLEPIHTAVAQFVDFAKPLKKAFTVTPAAFLAWAGDPSPESGLPPCEKCHGSGGVECVECFGDGYVECESCEHESKCKRCGGDGDSDCDCGRKRPVQTREPGSIGGIALDRVLARDAVAFFAEVAPGEPIAIEVKGGSEPVRFRAGQATFVLMPLNLAPEGPALEAATAAPVKP